MQVKTFIYGTPLGFNFYEDDSQYKDYFKGFYISSREGRRLMVNRLDNGETTYNFLCYRIAENHNRPNAFFGMSLVLSDYQYCSDFPKLYEWFDFLFNKLVNEHSLFKLQGNELQYNVSKFEDDREDVEWLKSNMPNILSSLDIKLQQYDASFSNKKTGQIIQFNNNEPIDKVLKAFKQSRWISISPIFAGQEDCLELDYMELSQNIESVTKQLLPIAIEPKQQHLALLKDFHIILKENYKIISEFVEKTKDEESKKLFVELGQRYYGILTQQLPQIAEKIKGDSIDSPLPTRICSKCGQQKPLNEFAEGDIICSECRAHESTHNTRVCEKCGRIKPLNAFESNDPVCKNCRDEETSDSVLPFPKKYLWGGVAVIAVLAIFIVGIQKFIPKKEIEPELTDLKSPITNNINIDKHQFENYITSNDFQGAFNYINGTDNAQEYNKELKEHYEQFLLSLTFEDILTVLIQSVDLCDSLKINKKTWKSYAEDGNEITKYLGKSSISDSDRRKCKNLIDKYLKGFYKSKAQEWNNSLEKIPQAISVVQNPEKNVDYRINNDKTFSRKSKNSCIGIELTQGDYVDIFLLKEQKPTCNKFSGGIGWHPESSPAYYRISTSGVATGKYVFQCGEDYQITITVQSKYQAIE